MELSAVLKSGTGGASPGTNANLVAITDGQAGTSKFLFDFEGDAFADGSTFTIYDDQDDAALVEKSQGFMAELGSPERLPDFDRMRELAALKLSGLVTPEQWKAGIRPMWSITGFVKLHHGALLQARRREKLLIEMLDELVPGFAATARKRLEATDGAAG